MKNVFSSHSQLAHVWAQQTQDSGRGTNMFFQGTDIYSYGGHYMAARIQVKGGKRFALVRSDTYSVSTSKHLSEIRRALEGLMPYFCVAAIDDPKLAVKQLDEQAQTRIAESLKRLKITSKDSIKWEFENIRGAFKQANELRKILGRVEKWPTKKQLNVVQAHLDKRLARYNELNTPEIIAARKHERDQLALKESERQRVLQAESIAKFRDGKEASLYNLGFDLIRVKGNEIQTSSGASVPLKHAMLLFNALQEGKDIRGARCGHFTVNAIYPVFNPGMVDDKMIEIGCHRILLSEAKAVLGCVA